MSDSSKNDHESPPFNDYDLGPNAARLIRDTPQSKKAKLIEKIELKPTDQRRIFLGNFRAESPPAGFSIEITPDPNPEGSVLTEVTSLGTTKQYKLTLLIANYGTRTVNAKVWELG